MSVEAITWALKLAIKPSATKFVLVAIANCADGKESVAWPSVAYLVEATSQDRKTVMQGIARLIDMGLITDTGERRGQTKQVIVYRINMDQDCENQQYQKRNSTGNGTVPKFPSNSTEIPIKEYRNSLGTVPKTVHGTVRNRQGTVKEPSIAPAKRVPAISAAQLVEQRVDKQVATEFLALRKRKRAPLTEIALAGIRREADRVGWTLDQVLRKCVERGWQGFEASWVKDEKATGAKHGNFGQQDYYDGVAADGSF